MALPLTQRRRAGDTAAPSPCSLTTPDGANLPAGATVEAFPLLVRLHRDWFDFAQAKADGADVRFTAGDGKVLAHQIEGDAAGGAGGVWGEVAASAGGEADGGIRLRLRCVEFALHAAVYIAFPNCDALRHELSWTHYRTLLRVEDAAAREWYVNEAVAQNWSSRALERQVARLYYERLLSSKDRKAVRAEAEKKIAELPPSPREFVRDPVLLEFLGLPETGRLLESDMEQALIDHCNRSCWNWARASPSSPGRCG